MKVKFKSFALLSAAVLTACGSGKSPSSTVGLSQSNKWGYYSGPVETRWENDGRSMTLLNELRYTDPNGFVWIAPAGSQLDGEALARKGAL